MLEHRVPKNWVFLTKKFTLISNLTVSKDDLLSFSRIKYFFVLSRVSDKNNIPRSIYYSIIYL